MFITWRESTCHLCGPKAHHNIYSYWVMWRAGFSSFDAHETWTRLRRSDSLQASCRIDVGVRLRFAGNSRKTFVCVSKGSLPGVNLMIVGGVGLTTVDPTEERWSGQTSGGNVTCWILALIFRSSPHMGNISLHLSISRSDSQSTWSTGGK